MKYVLFICTGNVCRSPMAEGFFRAMMEAEEQSGFRTDSAGIGAMNGYPPSEHSVDVMREEGIDITDQRSLMLTPDLVDEATHIFGMTSSHQQAIQVLYPENQEKVFVLREFVVDDELDRDVPDPIGMDRNAYERTRNLIKEAMPSVWEFVNASDAAEDLMPQDDEA